MTSIQILSFPSLAYFVVKIHFHYSTALLLSNTNRIHGLSIHNSTILEGQLNTLIMSRILGPSPTNLAHINSIEKGLTAVIQLVFSK